MNHHTKFSNPYLAQWLANEISDADLQQLVTETDFVLFQKIKRELSHYSIPSSNVEEAFSEVKQKLVTKQQHQKTKIWYSGIIAASVLFLAGMVSLFFIRIDQNTGYGAQKIVKLSDQSTLYVNANSKVNYPYLFRYNREVHLQGEAFFEVSKNKGAFIVNTDWGQVKVLGTSFNVVSRDDFFEVVCYTGTVEVTHLTTIEILHAGESVRFINNKTTKWIENTTTQDKPQWINGASDFKSVPYYMVIKAVENQFGKKIEFPDAYRQLLFTGSFPHDNLEKALLAVTIPLHLEFTVSEKNISIYKLP